MASAGDAMGARPQAAPAPTPRSDRITYACEACRAAKVKCQPGAQLGICKRCSESKRECIFKTGPRTRRPRQKRASQAPACSAPASASTPLRYPPPPGPSKTFTIDVTMPADDDIADSLEALRLAHERAIDDLVSYSSSPSEEEGEEGENNDDDGAGYAEYDGGEMDHDWADRASGAGSVLSHASSLPVGASALSTPPSSIAALAREDRAQGQPGAAVAEAEAERGASKAAKRTRTIASLRLQPQFNLDSAGQLLAVFRDAMLPHFHCVVIGDGDTVSDMARERPFVLLAVLAAASGSRTLQGHSLYDEEFRKVLGLKFVAGGERTLELLQGLMVYTAWYPFHLRPKNRQAVQYVRMAVDIIHDLELDEDPGTDSMDVAPTPERLAQIRIYLASYYLASAFASAWGRSPSLTYTDYTARCCDLLQHHSRLRGDHVLAWQARLQRLVDQTNELHRAQRSRSQGEREHKHEHEHYQVDLMIRGMETQLDEWEARIGAGDPSVAAASSVRIALLFTRVFLWGAPLLKMVGASASLNKGRKKRTGGDPTSSTTTRTTSTAHSNAFGPDPRRLLSVVPHLRGLYELYLSLDRVEANAFNGMEWGDLILAVILGFRLSFPLPGLCPAWDDRAGRAAVGFGGYLERLCRMGGDGGDGGGSGGEDAAEIRARLAAAAPAPGGGHGGPRTGAGAQRPNMDVLSASKIVLEMVKKKFERRVARAEAQTAADQSRRRQQQQQQQQPQQHQPQQYHQQQETAPLPPPIPITPLDSTMSGCPMMDGSMEPYYPYWDETFTNTLDAGAFAAGGAQGFAVGPAAAAAAGELDAAGLGVPNDLWTAMTVGWAQHGDLGFGTL